MTYVPTPWVDYGVPCIDAANLNNMEAGIDRAQGDVMLLRGLTAARPAFDPLLVGRIYFATDAPYEISRDNGTGWDVVGYTNDLFTALGTLQVGTGAGAAGPLGIGAAGNVLTVAAGTAAWAAPAGGAWTLIQEQILGAPAAVVTFAAIPGTYRALLMMYQARSDLAAEIDYVIANYNGDGGNNYDYVYFYFRPANARASAGVRGAAFDFLGAMDAANSRASCLPPGVVYWPGYALADREKFHITPGSLAFGDRSADADINYWANGGAWRNTGAIIQIQLSPNTGPNFVAPSRFALYGIT